jgi:hypothetical protein
MVHEGRQADAAVAHDDGRHTLADLGQHVRRAQHDLVVVGVHVDEAGRDDLPGDVDRLGTARVETRADFGDPSVADPDVGGVARPPGAVDDRSTAQENVAHLAGLRSLFDNGPCSTG